MSKLSTKPYKGARDFYPEDQRIQNYIFNVWRKTALSFGYEEYDFPFLERYELYEEKSGEDLVQNQLYSFKDRGDRKVAIRPEKTPSLARMVAEKVQTLPKPIRWFNIGNCWRYEKPQKGRGREFFQFDCDIFGVENITADVEVFSIPIEVMKNLGATKEMFELRVNNRRFAEFYLKEIVELSGTIDQKDTQLYRVTKAIDSRPKIPNKEFVRLLREAKLDDNQVRKVEDYLEADLTFVKGYLEDNEGARELIQFFNLMEKTGYGDFIRYSPEIMRGLDYYTGIVVEQFDLSPKNNRAMYGGGRYDNLVQLFSDEKVNGVGFAMGDITLLEFLKGWDLLPDLEKEIDYLVTLWPNENPEEKNKFITESFKISRELRRAGKNVITWLEEGTPISQQLSDANKQGVKNVIIMGPKELRKGTLSVKNMSEETQEEVSRTKFLKDLKK